MVEYWRLTRNRYGRAIYDRLADAGITATRMYEYVADLGTSAAPTPNPRPDLTVEVRDPTEETPLEAPTDALAPGEELLAAAVDGTTRGYVFLSIDAAHEITPLERTLSFEGSYLRRVYVDPDHRGRGVGTALVAAACERADDRGARRASALVAMDNRPSRSLFENCGFEPRRIRSYVRVGPLSRRWVRDR